MSQGLAFLIWLLCVGISAVLIGYFIKQSLNPVEREGFVVRVCPSGTNTFVTDEGETQCCNGDVVDGYCTGNLRCTLSPKSRSGLPTCTDLAISQAAAVGASKCPALIPNYFGSCDTVEGCSVSLPSADGLKPSNPNQTQCILYKTHEEDVVKLDSCYNVNQRGLKDAQCAAAKANASSPACAAATAAAAAAANAAQNCPAPPEPKFVLYGDWVGARIPVQKKHILPDTNIVYAIGSTDVNTNTGVYTKMVITDKNNIPFTSRYYEGSLNDLQRRVPDTAAANRLPDATGHYILGSA
uniref:Uncharacterized protein n=1 Tax=viral metagenome TaxID=1070528 RepID=A0A6C0DJE2_9ZZZZ